MKYSKTTLIAFAILALSACKHTDQENPSPLSTCLEDKIEAFKLEPFAQSIIKITRPNDTLYWFVDSIADGGEDVVNEDCELICVEDCECVGNIVFCNETHMNHPKEVIWEK